MASLNVLVKLLPSSPFRLSRCFFIGVRRFFSASCFYFHPPQFLKLCSRLSILFCNLDFIGPVTYIFKVSIQPEYSLHFFPFCLQCFLSFILCFGCISFQSFPCYSFSAAALGISVLQVIQESLIPCRITCGFQVAIP